MKQFQLINAYKATDKLSHNDKLSANTLWGIYNLRKQLFPHWEFQVEREKDLQQKYSQYADAEGNITGQSYKEYMEELASLLNLDKDISIEKIQIHLTDDLGITVEMMEALEDFVEFTK